MTSVADQLDPMDSLWHWLAYDVRRYRLKHGLSQEQLGRVIGLVKQTVCNIEANERKLTEEGAHLLDDLWDTGGHFMRLLTFARLNHNPDWFKEHVQFEAQASVLRIYEALVVPGLLQTEAYARDLFTMQGLKEPEKQVAARMARQKIFRRAEPPYVWALLNESAVDQPIGGATVMREQLEKLLSLSKLANFSIRIVPRSVGSHPGLGGPFKTMRAGRDEIGYAEAYLGGRVIRDRTEISMLNTSFDRIGAQALPEFLSRDLIRKVLEGMT